VILAVAVLVAGVLCAAFTAAKREFASDVFLCLMVMPMAWAGRWTAVVAAACICLLFLAAKRLIAELRALVAAYESVNGGGR